MIISVGKKYRDGAGREVVIETYENHGQYRGKITYTTKDGDTSWNFNGLYDIKGHRLDAFPMIFNLKEELNDTPERVLEAG